MNLAWEFEHLKILWEIWRLPAVALCPAGAMFAFLMNGTSPKGKRILLGALAVTGWLFQAVSLCAYLGERFTP